MPSCILMYYNGTTTRCCILFTIDGATEANFAVVKFVRRTRKIKKRATENIFLGPPTIEGKDLAVQDFLPLLSPFLFVHLFIFFVLINVRLTNPEFLMYQQSKLSRQQNTS